MGAISQVSNVLEVVIHENDTDKSLTLDAGVTLPPHSFMAVVRYDGEADTAQEIAAAILEKKPLGIQAYGLNTYSVTDSIGVVHAIGFTTAEQRNCTVTITATNSITEKERLALLEDLQSYVSENYGIASTIYALSMHTIVANSRYFTNIIDITIDGNSVVTASEIQYLYISELEIVVQ